MCFTHTLGLKLCVHYSEYSQQIPKYFHFWALQRSMVRWGYDLTLQRHWEDVRVPVRDICGGCIRDRAIMCHRRLGMLWILPSWEWVRCECSCLSGKLLMRSDVINLDDTFSFTGTGGEGKMLCWGFFQSSLVSTWRATDWGSCFCVLGLMCRLQKTGLTFVLFCSSVGFH